MMHLWWWCACKLMTINNSRSHLTAAQLSALTGQTLLHATSYVGHHPTTLLHSTHRSEVRSYSRHCAYRVADCPAMSLVLVCWHSRRWEPPICGGLLQIALLQLEKVKSTIFCCCKKHIRYTFGWWTSKKQDKKLTKTLRKTVFF